MVDKSAENKNNNEESETISKPKPALNLRPNLKKGGNIKVLPPGQ